MIYYRHEDRRLKGFPETNESSADTMSYQKKIIQKAHEKKANYVIALKDNQATTLEDASLYSEAFGATLNRNPNVSSGHRLVLAARAKKVAWAKRYRHGENQAILS